MRPQPIISDDQVSFSAICYGDREHLGMVSDLKPEVDDIFYGSGFVGCSVSIVDRNGSWKSFHIKEF